MKKNITILLFLLVNSIIGQTKQSDYFTFSKGGKTHLKPLKYVLYSPKENTKTTKDGKIYFRNKSERFVFDKTKHKSETCALSYLNKTKLENSATLRENEVLYYKTEIKKTEVYKKSGFAAPFPVTAIHPYFKVYVIEKIGNDKLMKYEVDWEYSDL